VVVGLFLDFSDIKKPSAAKRLRNNPTTQRARQQTNEIRRTIGGIALELGQSLFRFIRGWAARLCRDFVSVVFSGNYCGLIVVVAMAGCAGRARQICGP